MVGGWSVTVGGWSFMTVGGWSLTVGGMVLAGRRPVGGWSAAGRRLWRGVCTPGGTVVWLVLWCPFGVQGGVGFVFLFPFVLWLLGPCFLLFLIISFWYFCLTLLHLVCGVARPGVPYGSGGRVPLGWVV